MKHLHSLGAAFSGFKTAGTLCGKRVKSANLAVDVDADCPHCRAEAEKNHAVSLRMVSMHETQFGADANTRQLRAQLANGPTYRNARIGL